jgi:hypothetical protein
MATQYFRIDVKFSLGASGAAINNYVMRYTDPLPALDTAVLSTATTWMEKIYEPIKQYMDTNTVLASARVVEIDANGQTIREVGGISPGISGTSVADSLPAPVAPSITARTNTSRVRGGKRFPPFNEAASTEGFWINAIVNALVQVALAYLGVPDVFFDTWQAGVISSKVGGFVPFNGKALVSNVPGTQVTRKPGRGA